jgi:hypothetical protein
LAGTSISTKGELLNHPISQLRGSSVPAVVKSALLLIAGFCHSAPDNGHWAFFLPPANSGG